MLSTRLSRTAGLVLVLVFGGGCDFIVQASVDTSGGDPNSASLYSSMSADGRYVAFWSAANDIVPGDGNGRQDVVVRDLRTRHTVRASVNTSAGSANGDSFYPTISADGLARATAATWCAMSATVTCNVSS